MNRKYSLAFLILIVLSTAVLAIFFLCTAEIAVLNPKGWIALKQRNLLSIATFLMLIVVIPVFVIAFVFAWKYRSNNPKANYSPDHDRNHYAEIIWWGVPCIIVLILSVITWKSSHELDPFKPIDADKKPIEIQVVALQWRWLFIYPEQRIATLNFVQFPENTPLNFEITADAPMNSFWIPQLGGQIYAMSGMRSKLHLIANEVGSFRGSSANLSGEGFSKMTFIANSCTQAEFDQWVQSIKESSHSLNQEEYDKLAEPNENQALASYVLTQEDLFDHIVMKDMTPKQIVPKQKVDRGWLGKLTAEAFKHDRIEAAAGISILLGGAFIIGVLFYYKRWKWLWNNWLTSLDPKKIGVMYIVVTFLMLLKGVSDALMMRAQQILSVGESSGYLTSSHFQQIFTAHGTTMIFFVGMGIVFGLMNLILPLQIGARDVAFPFLNSVSFWLFSVGAALLIVSLNVGKFSATGWVAYPPLSGLKYSPGEGVDYWIWSVQIAGIGSLLAGVNFFVTIFKMRCPGMTLMKMPLFVWSCLGTLVLIIFAFPILTVTVGLLTLDRYFGMHFFTPDLGGSPMMFVNLIWAWGHPEVYILILPAFGVFSEVVATFSGKRLFGYVSMVWAIVAITFLSFIVWLHHFFTMGASANVNAFFGIMTMFIAIPTGVKIFNWLFTQYRGRVQFTTPMLWFIGFVIIFTIGGMHGVLMAIPAIDFQVHNSLFLIAHFHSVIIGGVVFGFFAAVTYWFPKIIGFKLDERLGKCAFWCWLIGFLAAFIPLYILGLMGATRRLDHYDAATGWQPLFIIAGMGVVTILCGIGFQILQVIVSIKQRKQNLDKTGDPWNGRTLEWSTTSPPPFYNFAVLPRVDARDPFWEMKQSKDLKWLNSRYEDFHMPKNTPMGLLIGGLSFVLGLALIWHIFWLALIGFLGIVVCLILHLSNDDTEYVVSAAELKKWEAEKSCLTYGH